MILCGTNLAYASESAVSAAAALAHKLGQRLLLVTVLEQPDLAARVVADARLARDAEEIRRVFDISVTTQIEHGVPEERLLDLAEKHRASLLVVGAHGGASHSRRFGSVPEHLCQRSEVPVFIARNVAGLLPWSERVRPLRVLMGSGLGDASRSALEYVGGWSDIALTVAHVAWPFGEHYRLGVAAPIPLDHLHPEIHRQVLGDLGRWVAEVPGHGSTTLCAVAGFGRIDCHLAQLAREKQADLLVVGSHPRNVASRVWHGSVSRNAVQEADCNVLCVPHRSTARMGTTARTVVVPTDFSALADRAIPYAYSLLEHGGTLHLLHVVEQRGGGNEVAIEAQLAARIPPEATSHAITTEVHVLEGAAAWLAIWQYAGRVSADLICMATHSRDAARSVIVGSTAREILQHSKIPMLLVPPDRER